MFKRRKNRLEEIELSEELEAALNSMDPNLIQLCSTITMFGRIIDTMKTDQGMHFTINMHSPEGTNQLCIISIQDVDAPRNPHDKREVGFTADVERHHGYL